MNGVGAGLEGKWAWPEWGAWLLVRSVGMVREGGGARRGRVSTVEERERRRGQGVRGVARALGAWPEWGGWDQEGKRWEVGSGGQKNEWGGGGARGEMGVARVEGGGRGHSGGVGSGEGSALLKMQSC